MSKVKSNLSRASVVRLIACQALCVYNDKSLESQNMNEILESINDYYVKEYLGKENSTQNDYKTLYKTEFLNNMLDGLLKDEEKINDILEKEIRNFSNTIENLLDTTRECFKLAIYEMLNFADLAPEIIISEYVDIVAEFTNDDNETKFANKVLENLSVKLRGKKEKNIDNKNIENNKSKHRKVISLQKKTNEETN